MAHSTLFSQLFSQKALSAARFSPLFITFKCFVRRDVNLIRFGFFVDGAVLNTIREYRASPAFLIMYSHAHTHWHRHRTHTLFHRLLNWCALVASYSLSQHLQLDDADTNSVMQSMTYCLNLTIAQPIQKGRWSRLPGVAVRRLFGSLCVDSWLVIKRILFPLVWNNEENRKKTLICWNGNNARVGLCAECGRSAVICICKKH